MKANDFDKKFNKSENIIGHLDLSKARRPALNKQDLEQKRVNVDFPTWMVNAMDTEATRLGVTRQSLIKMWLAERLEPVRHS
jgi:hypothetical protein